MSAKKALNLAARTAAVVVCTCGVPLLTLGLVQWLYGVPISAFRPLINDEVVYWHQASTFSHAGFSGGYYTLNEATNPSGFTPFGPHGAGFPVAYGLAGTLFGWHRHDVVVLNLLLIGAAGWLWCALTRLTTGRLLTSALLLLTFWPMVFWAASGMQEGLHLAGTIVFAALFARALHTRPPSWPLTVIGWIVLVLFAYIRPSWTVLMPLWALVTATSSSARGIAARLAGSALVAVLAIVAFSRSAAPVPSSFFFMGDLATAAQVMLNSARMNVARVLQVADYSELEVLNRIQYFGWLAATTVGAAVVWTSRRREERVPAHLPIAAVSIVAIVGLLFVFYAVTNWTEHRIVSAFVLFGALLCTAAPGRLPLVLATLLVLSNVATTPLLIRGFEEGHRDQFIWDRRGVAQLGSVLEGHVAYQTTQSRWCNTLLTAQYPPHLIAVPGGIGLSVVREPDTIAMPPRSRFMLLDEPSQAEFTAPLNLKALATLPYGTLYENLDARCGPDKAR